MRKAATLLLLMVTLLSAVTATAQQKADAKISSVKQRGKVVAIAITSAKPFIFGGNRYMLYVGSKEFTQYEQTKDGGKGVLTFLIPSDRYAAFTDGDDMYLTYGRVFRNDNKERSGVALTNHRAWSLGTYSPAMTTKAKATK